MMTIFRRAMLGAALLANSQAIAQPAYEDLALLDARIADALAAPVGARGGALMPIDRRLRLAPCPTPATILAPVAGAVTVRCTTLGWRIRVSIGGGARQAGQGAGAAEVASEPLIRRGENVDLVIMARGFSVSGAGTAEQSGAAGDRIRVRLSGGNRVATGQIRNDGRIAISGFN